MGNLYDTLIQKVKQNRSTREELFVVEMRKAIERKIGGVAGFQFPITIQVNVDRNECCDEMMSLIKGVMRREGFHNFDAQFGHYSGDPRDMRDYSYSFVKLTIRENKQAGFQ
ncbi:hypothetical protein OLCHANIL_00025 [Vibrio phage V05]|nr:hypothetical protein pp2_301 [Vibrio phage phi-pp2]QHJ74484.1 hypothetical protein VH12019_00157 [Vibrio phage VH1_2019]QIW90122.1 hypothetical protein OLCHANIL_00025 [Vibrio phage V05]QIW91110.1 hypothetical protein COHAPHLL_00274 [Vibrio phage V09]WOL24836.1 hypothetical protein [Vibrio phage PG216]